MRLSPAAMFQGRLRRCATARPFTINAATVLSPYARVSCLSGMAGEIGESTRLHLTFNFDLRL